MAVPLIVKVPWWRKFHYRNIWRKIKQDWRRERSLKELFWEDRYSYLIIIAGVALGCLLIGTYFLFWNASLNKYGS